MLSFYFCLYSLCFVAAFAVVVVVVVVTFVVVVVAAVFVVAVDFVVDVFNSVRRQRERERERESFISRPVELRPVFKCTN